VKRFIQTLKREWAYAHSWPRFRRAHPGPGILPSLLQPASPAQLIGRAAADHGDVLRLEEFLETKYVAVNL